MVLGNEIKIFELPMNRQTQWYSRKMYWLEHSFTDYRDNTFVRQGGLTKALTVGQAATTVKLQVNSQGPEIALKWVNSQDDLRVQNPKSKTLRI